MCSVLCGWWGTPLKTNLYSEIIDWNLSFYKKTKNLMETGTGMRLGTFFAYNKQIHHWEAAFQSKSIIWN